MSLDYPWYFFLFCLLLGAAFSCLLYFFDRKRLGKLQWWLGALRFLSVTLIAFLLLAPLVKRDIHQKEKPIVVVAQDVSKSLDYCKDSAYYHTDYAKDMQRLIDDLSKDYDVQCYTYGDVLEQGVSTTPDYSTNISQALSDIAQHYAGRNLGAVVLSGDGIYNQGANPTAMAERANFAIYTIALGDTSLRRDATIANVRCNRIAYLGNQFPMEITVRATRLKGEKRMLTVSRQGKQLFSKATSYSSDDYVTTETVLLDADQPGLHNYTIRIAPCDDEATLQNNTLQVAVEVIDGRQKIAILAAAPHPDVAALKQSIESNQNYEVSVFVGRQKEPLNLRDYDLLILHNLPSATDFQVTNSSTAQCNIPTIYIIGAQTHLPSFNNLHAGLEVITKLSKQQEVSPQFNSHFSSFSLDESTCNHLLQMPPLVAPFGEYRVASGTQCLFTAKIGSVNSDQPLIAFSQQGGQRAAFVVGEGLWRWRLADYQANGSHSNFDALINKMVVYTSLQENKQRFRITSHPVFRQGEDVVLEAELYNDNYEPVNTPEVTIEISSDEEAHGKSDKYAFNRNGTGYYLNLGVLAPGGYSYTAHCASAPAGNQKLTGHFVVEALNLEALNLVADHSLLNTLAQTTGGAMLYPQQIDQLPQLLKQRSDMQPVIYSHTRYTQLLNLPLIFILIVLLLGVEWIVRKYNGEI